MECATLNFDGFFVDEEYDDDEYLEEKPKKKRGPKKKKGADYEDEEEDEEESFNVILVQRFALFYPCKTTDFPGLLEFIFQLREYPCNITHDIFFFDIPQIFLERS